MSTKKEEELPRQLEHVPPGSATATSQEVARILGHEDERLKDAPGGSETPIEGGEPKPDAIATKGIKPVGLQKEASTFVGNGTVDIHNTVATNYGPAPIGVAATTADAAEDVRAERKERFEAEQRGAFAEFERIPEEVIGRMSAAELRAVAANRGYDIGPDMGRRATRARFLAVQADDNTLIERE